MKNEVKLLCVSCCKIRIPKIKKDKEIHSFIEEAPGKAFNFQEANWVNNWRQKKVLSNAFSPTK